MSDTKISDSLFYIFFLCVLFGLALWLFGWPGFAVVVAAVLIDTLS